MMENSTQNKCRMPNKNGIVYGINFNCLKLNPPVLK
jgi:hypothetical protein